MRALITGASGFVGTWLIRHLLECGDYVCATVYDARWKDVAAVELKTRMIEQLRETCTFGPKELDSAQSRLEVCSLDVTSPEQCAQVLGSARPEAVFHLAGLAFVPDAESDFSKALQVNVAGTHNVARVCHLLQQGARFLLVSSAEVFGRAEQGRLPFQESSGLEPVNAYSSTKVMAEMVAERFSRLGNISVCIMRPFNHIGPGQDARFVAASFASQLAAIAVGQAAPVMRVGNLEAQRDFSDVRDIVRAYRLAAMQASGTYVLSSGRAVSIQSILNQLISISGLRVDVQLDQARMRPAEVPIVYGSSAKALKDFGWKPEIELAQTLKDIYAYWLRRAKGKSSL